MPGNLCLICVLVHSKPLDLGREELSGAAAAFCGIITGPVMDILTVCFICDFSFAVAGVSKQIALLS